LQATVQHKESNWKKTPSLMIGLLVLQVRSPLTLDMANLNGNEKHAKLPQTLLFSASRPRTIRQGDLMFRDAIMMVAII
jgi:hypothetical protein